MVDIRNIGAAYRVAGADAGLAEDADFGGGGEQVAYLVREVADADGFVGTDVAGLAAGAVEQQGEQPDDQIAGVEVAAQRAAVAVDDDRPALERLGDEIADGVVQVERQPGAGEAEAAGRGRDASRAAPRNGRREIRRRVWPGRAPWPGRGSAGRADWFRRWAFRRPVGRRRRNW